MKKKQSFVMIEHQFTSESDCGSEEGHEQTPMLIKYPQSTPSGLNNNKFQQFYGISPSQKSKKHPQLSKDNLFSTNKMLSEADSQTPDHVKEKTIDSMTNVSPNRDDLESSSNPMGAFNKHLPKSSKNLNEVEGYHQSELHKSGTDPYINITKEYGGYAITTRLLQNGQDLKKQKEKEKQRIEISCQNKSTNYLSPANSKKSEGDSKMAASRLINESRITLKDYLFMAHASSKKAAEVKRTEVNESRKIIKTEPALQPTSKPSIPHLIPRIRERHRKQKYHLSNAQMGDVLKNSINQQIEQLHRKAGLIDKWMQVHEQINGEQLILLSTMRNDLKNYNRKLEESINQLTSPDRAMFIGAICGVSMNDVSFNQQLADQSQIYGQI